MTEVCNWRCDVHMVPHRLQEPYVVSLMVMSYAEIDLAMVPAAPPTRKNHRATSCPCVRHH